MTTAAARTTCVACDALVDGSADRCSSCGSPLDQPVRRLVAVLFADLAGYTAWCSSRDPEDVHLLVRPLMNALRRTCEAFGGSVLSIEGDGMMAVFGARRGDEAAARKAVLAGARLLSLVDDRRDAFRGGLPGLKVGVHAGEVVVAPSWEATGFSVSGDTVNLARRICDAASPGQLRAHEVVAELVPAAEAWGPTERVQVKGAAEPVPVRDLRRTRLPATLAGLPATSTTPFVGRADLLVQVDAAMRSGHTLLRGEAGAGKTRLAEAWLASRDSRRLVVRCPSFSPDGPWSALSELAEALLPDADDANARALRRLAGHVVDSLETDGEDAVVAALAGEVRRQHESAPLVLLVDDVHEASRPVLALLAGLEGVPVLGTSRSDTGHTWTTTVHVPALTLEDADTLVDHLLPGADEEVRDLLRTRCGGMPLFLEQCARMLRDDGLVVPEGDALRLSTTADVRAVPTTMRLFVAARLDRLPDDEAKVLAVASVIGDDIDVDLLRHLLQDDPAESVDRLVDKSLLEWQAASEGRPRLRFAHALVRDVAYDGQLRSDRLSRHLLAAEWYAVLPVASVLEAQAQHLEAAVRLGEPDCDLVRRTVEAMVLHARAISEERPAESGDVLDRAAALVGAHPACAVDRLVLDLTRVAALNAAAHYAEAVDLGGAVVAAARERDQRDVLAEALLQLARGQWRSDPGGALANLDEAQRRFEELDDVASAAEVDIYRAYVVEREQGLRATVVAHERAFERARRAGDARLQSTAAHQLAMHAFVDSRRSFDHWRDVAEALQRQDDKAGPATLAAAGSAVALYARDDAQAHELGTRAQHLGLRAGLYHPVYNGMVIELEGLVLCGELERADRRVVEGHELARSRQVEIVAFHIRLVEMALRRRQGRPAEAAALRARLADEVGQYGAIGRADLDERLALDALERGDFAGARAWASAALSTHDERDQPFLKARISVTWAAATVSARAHATLSEVSNARREARERGAPEVEALLARWWDLDDALRGHSGPGTLPPSGLVEGRALELDAQGLRGDHEGLLEAATAWSQLGVTVFWARSLLWHEALTGQAHPEARDLLQDLDAPAGTADLLLAQVEPLRSARDR